MWIVHLSFAAFLVVLIYAMNRQGESAELLAKGLDLARRADAAAMRAQMAQMQADQAKHHAELLALLAHAEKVRADSAAAIGDGRTGKGHAPEGHGKGGNLTNWG